jgi:hypothetical protein
MMLMRGLFLLGTTLLDLKVFRVIQKFAWLQLLYILNMQIVIHQKGVPGQVAVMI